MGFLDIRFPVNVSYGTLGGPALNTSVTEMDGGHRQAVSRWSGALRRYDVVISERKQADYAAVIDFFLVVEGAANSWRYKDWSDYASVAGHVRHLPGAPAITATDQDCIPSAGDGSNKDFQLAKTYAVGAIEKARTITKPVSGTVVVAIDGTPQASGWSVNLTTGVVTFTSAPTAGQIITAGYEFDVPCAFGQEVDQDGLPGTIDSYEGHSVRSIPVYEVADAVEMPERAWFGGGVEIDAMGADIRLSWTSERYQRVSPTVAGLSIYMPALTPLPGGGPHYVIENLSGANTLAVRDVGGTLLFTLGLTSVAQLWIYRDSNGDLQWGWF